MKNKIIFNYLSVFILLLIFISFFYFGHFNKLKLIGDHSYTEKININNFFETFESQDTKALSATLDGILQDTVFKKLFLKQNRDELNEYGQPLFQKLKVGYGITHFYFILPDGTTFLRLHNPSVFGDLNNRITFKQAVKSNNVGSGIELGKTAFALRVVKPYYDGDKLIGYIELGQEIDHFLSVLKEETNNEYAIFVNKKNLNQDDWNLNRKYLNKEDNWNKFSTMILTNSTVDLDSTISETAKFCFSENNAQSFLLGSVKNGSIINMDLKMACSGFLIKDASGDIAGVVIFTHDLSDGILSIGLFINKINLLASLMIVVTALGAIFNTRKNQSFEKKYKYLFENSMDAILILEPPTWNFSDGNKASISMFGVRDLKELRSVSPSDLSPESQPDGQISVEKAKEMIDIAIKDGTNFFEWTHKKLNGDEFIAQVSLSKIDNSQALQVVVRDITKQKKALDLIKESEGKALKSLQETEKMNKLMVGRELEMINLKRELADLKNNLK